ncbi:uncharacterized protein VTP21DRAFT_2534 [Calcarisporiella thermophila]|uniref:uncharacterized protein n=1 Tax=Calcarisporiella thermophila TaxID=911321 RepID=UPI003744A563
MADRTPKPTAPSPADLSAAEDHPPPYVPTEESPLTGSIPSHPSQHLVTSFPPPLPQQTQPQYGIYIMRIPDIEAERRVREFSSFPMAALLFLLGWPCPILWCIGACCYLSSMNPFERAWAKACLIMMLLSVLVGVMLMLVDVLRTE